MPDCRTDHGLVDDRVGIEEYENVATRLAGPGVSGRGDLPVGDRNHPAAVLTGDGRGAVAGRIIDDDDLERLPHGNRRLP